MTIAPYVALGGLITTIAAGIYGLDKGKKLERLEWQTANVETLVGANTGLFEHIEGLKGQIADNQLLDIDTSGKITTVETRVIERIKEVPVERIIKIDGDCRVDYGIISLRNNWAKGDSLDKPVINTETGYLPLVGAQEVP